MTGSFLPDYVEAVLASRRLPPKAAELAYSRHFFVKGIRNGGLDLLKTAVSVSDTGKRMKSSARQRFFLFPAVEADV